MAAKLVRTRGLTPPIPVQDIVEEFADLQFDKLPANSDAVVVKTGPYQKRPLVIVDRTRPLSRRRFTLGHELAHLLIPWHVGTVSCHESWEGYLDGWQYRFTEAEANRFASELLLPTSWVEPITLRCATVAEMVGELKAAQTSLAAISLKLCKVLPPGYAFAQVNDAGEVILSGTPNGSLVPKMPKGSVCTSDLYAVCVHGGAAS